MIRATTFFGLPLRTRRQRRTLVVVYGLLIAVYLAVALRSSPGLKSILLPMTITLGGLLGGIRSGGPVKAYEQASAVNPDLSVTTPSYPIQTLQLNATSRRIGRGGLDEREQAQRDHAHYRAYQMLRWIVGITVIGYVFLLQEDQSWLLAWSPLMLWSLLMVTLSLPQCVLLWMEPDAAAAGDLSLVAGGGALQGEASAAVERP